MAIEIVSAVILSLFTFGTLARLYPGFERGWDWLLVLIIVYYWGISGYSLVFGDIGGAVNRVRNTSSDADI